MIRGLQHASGKMLAPTGRLIDYLSIVTWLIANILAHHERSQPLTTIDYTACLDQKNNRSDGPHVDKHLASEIYEFQ